MTSFFGVDGNVEHDAEVCDGEEEGKGVNWQLQKSAFDRCANIASEKICI